MNKRSATIVGIAAGVVLLLITGCDFFGGQEETYTYWEPSVSPDGSKIAYESTADSSIELFTLDLTTNAERQLTNDEYTDWSPVWSPDGSRIAFASSRDKNVDIYLLDVDTLGIVRLTTHEADDINPDWAADGLIYFNSNRSDAWEIYSINPDTLDLRKVSSIDSTSP